MNFISSHTTKFCLPSLMNAGLLYPIGFQSINHHSSHHILTLRPECAQVDTKVPTVGMLKAAESCSILLKVGLRSISMRYAQGFLSRQWSQSAHLITRHSNT